jgi:hypothetical protein
MEERNLDLEVPLSETQWTQLGQAAKANQALGYEWKGNEPDRIHVYLRDEEARGLWDRLVSEENQYGAQRVEIAQFVFNDGRPFAHLEAPAAFEEPAVNSPQEDALEVGQERFVREKWHQLVERSGIQGPTRDVR